MRYALIFIAVLMVGLSPKAHGQDFVYRPKNPAFGGSPAHFSWMFQSAQAQKSFDEGSTSFRRDPLQDFQDQLQRRLLNQLSREIVGDRFGDGANLLEDGSFEFGDFFVEVQEGPDGLRIQIINALTGDSSTITVPALGGDLP